MIDQYVETRVIMSPLGELLLALPIYADQKGAIVGEKDLESLIGLKASLGIYEQFGFLVYHPSSDFSFYLESIELFEDLGTL